MRIRLCLLVRQGLVPITEVRAAGETMRVLFPRVRDERTMWRSRRPAVPDESRPWVRLPPVLPARELLDLDGHAEGQGAPNNHADRLAGFLANRSSASAESAARSAASENGPGGSLSRQCI